MRSKRKFERSDFHFINVLEYQYKDLCGKEIKFHVNKYGYAPGVDFPEYNNIEYNAFYNESFIKVGHWMKYAGLDAVNACFVKPDKAVFIGPYNQPPLNYNWDSPEYLQDLSYMEPNEYKYRLDQFIVNHWELIFNGSHLYDMQEDYRDIPEQYKEEVREMVKDFLWGMTNRTAAAMHMPIYMKYLRLWAPMCELEHQYVEKDKARQAEEWEMREKAWLKMMQYSNHPEDIDLLDKWYSYYEEDEIYWRDRIRREVITFWNWRHPKYQVFFDMTK